MALENLNQNTENALLKQLELLPDNRGKKLDCQKMDNGDFLLKKNGIPSRFYKYEKNTFKSILNLENIREWDINSSYGEYKLFSNAMKIGAYKEIIVSGEYRFYKGEQEINILSNDFYEAWMEIGFLVMRQHLESGKINTGNKDSKNNLGRILTNAEGYHIIDEVKINNWMKIGSMTIFDLIIFKENNQLSPNDLFDKYRDNLIKLLPEQILDKKFHIDSRLWSSLLEKYKTQISKDIYEKSVEQIKRLEAKEKNIQGMLGNQFKAELDILKNGVA